jgi:hypothetical protein
MMTERGAQLAAELFEKHFGISARTTPQAAGHGKGSFDPVHFARQEAHIKYRAMRAGAVRQVPFLESKRRLR